MLTDREVLSILQAEERASVSYWTSEIADEQAENLSYYLGEPFGDEQDGRSSVVSRDVAEVIDWMMPDLLRVFMATDEVVRFEPQNPNDEAFAKQATEYANFIFTRDNPGFRILHDWFKDALLQKVGIVKVYWEDETEYTKETMMNVSTVDMIALGNDDNVEILEADEHPFELYPDGVAYDMTIRRKEDNGHVCIESVPQEEFGISARAVCLDEARYTVHRTKKTRSELKEMGVPDSILKKLSKGAQTLDSDPRAIERYEDEQWLYTEGSTSDESQDEFEYLEEYSHIDYDQDGVAELRQITRVGSHIISNEEIDEHPWAELCPVPMPHKFYGLSLADQTKDIQRISSVLLRQALDNLYLSNAPRQEVVMPQTTDHTISDLLTHRPGGVIRVKAPNTVNPQEVPFVAGPAFEALNFMTDVKERRTGVKPNTQYLENDALHNTLGGQQMLMSAANQRKEMIARIFAETGMKTLFKKILKLIVKYQNAPRIIRLRDEWVEMDPRSWNANMDVTITVGLGFGSKEQQAANMLNVLNLQKESMQIGMANPEKLYNAAEKYLEALGIKNAGDYFVEPRKMQSQQQQPNPDVVKAQMDAQIKKYQIDTETQLKLYQINKELELKAQTVGAELNLKETLAAAGFHMDGLKAGLSTDVKLGGEPG